MEILDETREWRWPQYGTSQHYPDCVGRTCTGCLPPVLAIDGEPVSTDSPYRWDRPEPTRNYRTLDVYLAASLTSYAFPHDIISGAGA